MSEIKPYAYYIGALNAFTTSKDEAEKMGKQFPVETLYPAAAYEALHKELGYSKMAADAEAEFANEYKAKFEALKAENDKLKQKNEDFRDRIKKLEAEQKYSDHMKSVKF